MKSKQRCYRQRYLKQNNPKHNPIIMTSLFFDSAAYPQINSVKKHYVKKNRMSRKTKMSRNSQYAVKMYCYRQVQIYLKYNHTAAAAKPGIPGIDGTSMHQDTLRPFLFIILCVKKNSRSATFFCQELLMSRKTNRRNGRVNPEARKSHEANSGVKN